MTTDDDTRALMALITTCDAVIEEHTGYSYAEDDVRCVARELKSRLSAELRGQETEPEVEWVARCLFDEFYPGNNTWDAGPRFCGTGSQDHYRKKAATLLRHLAAGSVGKVTRGQVRRILEDTVRASMDGSYGDDSMPVVDEDSLDTAARAILALLERQNTPEPPQAALTNQGKE